MYSKRAHYSLMSNIRTPSSSLSIFPSNFGRPEPATILKTAEVPAKSMPNAYRRDFRTHFFSETETHHFLSQTYYRLLQSSFAARARCCRLSMESHPSPRRPLYCPTVVANELPSSLRWTSRALSLALL